VHSDIRGGGVTRSIREVAAEKADIGGSSRRHMWGEGHERGVTMIPFAWDGLAVIVNKTNPAKKIRIDDLRKVCLGEITNCKELGGADQPVKLFVREGRSSGVGSSTRKLLFGRYDQQFKPPGCSRQPGHWSRKLQQLQMFPVETRCTSPVFIPSLWVSGTRRKVRLQRFRAGGASHSAS
jgi:ABC-type phosphate transport system substrate-binding protein